MPVLLPRSDGEPRFDRIVPGLRCPCHQASSFLPDARRRPAFHEMVRWSIVGILSTVVAGRMVTQHLENRRLRRSNQRLALLSEVNHRIAESSSLDAILDHAMRFGARLVPTRCMALVLVNDGGAIDARLEGADARQLQQWRHDLRVMPPRADDPSVRWRRDDDGHNRCLLAPLHDGVAPVGWIEFYLEPGRDIPADDLALLETIGGEIAEAIVGTRYRAREARRLVELEQAISDERARIARDIHDGLAQTLAFERMRIDLWLDWIEDDPERLRGELRGLKDGLREQIGELRRAIFALRPVQFDQLGFLGGLQQWAVEFADQQGWTIDLDVASAPAELPGDLEAPIFRLVQEALTNVAKHAGASRVWIRVAATDQGLVVVVRDDGRGFDPDRLNQPGAVQGLGLRQMSERLAALRGRLSIDSGQGKGTELRAWLPFGVGGGTGSCDVDEEVDRQ